MNDVQQKYQIDVYSHEYHKITNTHFGIDNFLFCIDDGDYGDDVHGWITDDDIATLERGNPITKWGIVTFTIIPTHH